MMTRTFDAPERSERCTERSVFDERCRDSAEADAADEPLAAGFEAALGEGATAVGVGRPAIGPEGAAG